ncbi:MAG: hypothetical protein KAT70_04025, partial [Thermoplasmata archaeon]|nr:hypothetical protein [Thermoplasmata archaeon]
LLAPVGPEVTDKTDEEVDQEFTRIQRKKNEFIKTPLGGVLFVPLASKDTRNIQADKNFKPPKTTIEEEFKNNTDFIKKLHKLVEENEEISRFRERIATVRRCPLNLAPCGKLREIKKSYSEKNIFVDIPYKEEYLHFEQAISETLEENGLNPVFAKDETKSHELLCKVCRSIQSCNYGIADISYQSSNVLYELGMMHALGMDVAILKDKNAKKPSDISGKEDIRYANTEQLKAQLGKWIKDSIMTK